MTNLIKSIKITITMVTDGLRDFEAFDDCYESCDFDIFNYVNHQILPQLEELLIRCSNLNNSFVDIHDPKIYTDYATWVGEGINYINKMDTRLDKLIKISKAHA